MINNRGQSLVVFIVIIPLILIFIAALVDLGVVISKKVKLKEVTYTIVKEVIDKDNKEDLIIKLYKENDIDVSNLVVTNNNKLNIKNEIEVKSIFASIIGIKKYKIKVNVIAYYDNNKLIIE